MTWIDRILGRRAPGGRRDEPTPDTIEGWRWGPFGLLMPDESSITPEAAMRLGAYFGAIRAISEDLATLPLKLYREVDDGAKDREEVRGHPAKDAIGIRRGRSMSGRCLRELLTAHALGRGNGFAEIIRARNGKVTDLRVIDPDRVLAITEGADGTKRFRIAPKSPDGTVQQQRAREYADADVLHIFGPSPDGLSGYSIAKQAARSLGIATDAERYGEGVFANDARPGGVLTHPGRLNRAAQDAIAQSWEADHRGPRKAGKVTVLAEGMKYETVQIAPEDAQFIQTREFSVEEIARWFRIPPHKIGDLRRSTYSNIEHQEIQYVTDTLLPWLKRWEEELTRKLLTEGEDDLYFEHTADARQRGDTAARYQSYAVGRQWGWLSADDVRRKENMEPLPDGQGEIYLVPGNMVDADSIANPPEPPEPPPTPPPVPQPPLGAPGADGGPPNANGADNGDTESDSGTEGDAAGGEPNPVPRAG